MIANSVMYVSKYICYTLCVGEKSESQMGSEKKLMRCILKCKGDKICGSQE